MALTNDQITALNFRDFYSQIRPYLNSGTAHGGFTPIGTVISVMGKTAPHNYLVCDGTVYNIADYPELAAYFAGQFNTSNFFGGNGTTTFAVPDLRGEFLRGTGTNGHTNQGAGASVGVHQDATLFPNFFGSTGSTGTIDIAKTSVSNRDSSTGTTGKARYSSASDTGSNYDVNFTSRPTNTSVLYCIATKNIFMDAGHNYSFDEQVVGTWVDGKPIYQKTIDFGYLPNNAAKTVAHNISNLGWVVDAKGTAYNGSGGYRSIPILYNTTYASYNTAFLVRLTDIQLEVNNDMSAFYAYVTIQYTKTTD